MDQPIIFIAPKRYAGMSGIQRVNDLTHEVEGVFLLPAMTDVSGEAISYRGTDSEADPYA